MSHAITVTGAPPDPSIRGGRPYPRRRIQDLIQDEKQFSLYVQSIGESNASRRLRSNRFDYGIDYFDRRDAEGSCQQHALVVPNRGHSWCTDDALGQGPENGRQCSVGVPLSLIHILLIIISGFRGYCAHASVTFPTWHRPYLLLFEARLVTRLSLSVPSDLRT